MSRWTCPACDREFGRARQSHVCVPGCTVDECFAGHPPVYREIYDELLEHLESLGPVHADAVRVGVFLKSDHKIAEVRPKARSLSLALMMPRPLSHPRISREIRMSGGRAVCFVKLVSVEEVDDQVRDWLTEAYLAATDTATDHATDL